MELGRSLPDADARGADDHKEQVIDVEFVTPQPTSPIPQIDARRRRKGLRVRVPLSEVSARPSAFTPARIENRLVEDDVALLPERFILVGEADRVMELDEVFLDIRHRRPHVGVRTRTPLGYIEESGPVLFARSG